MSHSINIINIINIYNLPALAEVSEFSLYFAGNPYIFDDDRTH